MCAPCPLDWLIISPLLSYYKVDNHAIYVHEKCEEQRIYCNIYQMCSSWHDTRAEKFKTHWSYCCYMTSFYQSREKAWIIVHRWKWEQEEAMIELDHYKMQITLSKLAQLDIIYLYIVYKQVLWDCVIKYLLRIRVQKWSYIYEAFISMVCSIAYYFVIALGLHIYT